MLLEHHYQDKGIESIYLSSNVIMSRYLPDSQELIVIFKGGTQYIYEKLDLITYIDFVRAESQGKFISTNIVNKFKTTKTDKVVDIKMITEMIQEYKSKLSK